MTIDPHLSRPEHGVAFLIHVVLVFLLAWRLTRHSADLSYGLLGSVCCVGQAILIFAFVADHLAYLCIAVAICFWVSWKFIGYISDMERPDVIKLAIANPLFAIVGVYAVHLATL